LTVGPFLWRPRSEDGWPLIVIVLLPLLVALPQLVGLFKADPMLYVAGLSQKLRPGYLSGYPYIDPSSGFYTQALGRLAADQWLRGVVPWWNSYTGMGMPLAGSYNPAVFSPLTMLLLLPNGMVWRHLALQILAGWGSYGLLRQIGLAPLAALTGGLLFAQNGALAWFAHTPPDPGVFLPWVLLGIERAVARAVLAQPHGWRLLGIAMGGMLVAGFPETAYICGLFALVWAALRWMQCPAGCRLGSAWRLLLGCAVGLALAAPQILSFLEVLLFSFVGGHAGAFAHLALAPRASLPSLLAPYAYGPIFAYPQWAPLDAVWGNIGGYVDIMELALAAYGLWHRRDALSWMLCAWVVLTIAKTLGIPPVAEWWNLVPGISMTAFYRYATPTWEIAIFILAAFGIDALSGAVAQRRGPVLAASAVLVVGIGFLLAYAARLWPLEPIADLHKWMLVSAAWAMITGAFAVSLLVWSPRRWRARATAALLVLDATLMFAIPTLSTPRDGTIDMAAIGFLRRNLGLERFYTLGPIAPNYGAYFGIASINHNYIPVPRLWVDWVIARLDRGIDPVLFIGYRRSDPNQPSVAQELRRNLASYEEVGVKYVVAPAGGNPFIEAISPPTLDHDNRPLALMPGQSAQGVIPPGALASRVQIGALGVLIGTYGNTADGWLNVTLCTSGQCVCGSAGLAGSHDNAIFWMALTHPLVISASSAVTYTVAHQAGTKPVALWAYPTNVSQSLTGPEGRISGFGLQLQLRETQSTILAQHIYGDQLVEIYQLPAPKPYFETPGRSCVLQPQSRTSVIADCAMAAVLVRRELFFPGWEASNDGKSTPIAKQGGLFQSINLPAGHSTVTYHYAPPHIIWAWLLTGLAIIVLAIASMAHAKRPQY
jgi:hypothetical protein